MAKDRMGSRESDTRKVIEKAFPGFSNPGNEQKVLHNVYGDRLLAKRVVPILTHPLWKNFDKSNTAVKIRMIESGRVPREFAIVYDFKAARYSKKNKRRLSLMSRLMGKGMPMSQDRQEFAISETLKIVNNDCGKELDTMEAGSVSVVVTSPPYNIGIDYNSYEDNKSDKEYTDWMQITATKLKRVLEEGGSVFLNVGGTNVDPGIPGRVCQAFAKAGLVLQNHIVWVKSISIVHEPPAEQFKKMLNDLGVKPSEFKKAFPKLDYDKLEAEVVRTHGHFKPINSQRFLNNCFEDIYHFTKTGNVPLDRLAVGVPYEHKSNIDRWQHNTEQSGEKRDLRCRGNVWHIPYKTVVAAKQHPAGYPSELVEQCIKLHGKDKVKLVLDPFLGAGTTLEACKKLGLPGVGIELDEAYCQMGVDRLLVVPT
jgi:site-specific DNA-methyltransferase (adenine-specific)